MEILLKLCASLALAMGAIFAFLPGAFGLLNFRNEQRQAWLKRLATLSGCLVLFAHPLALYQLWQADTPYRWLLLPVGLHLLFFGVFGRNVSTR